MQFAVVDTVARRPARFLTSFASPSPATVRLGGTVAAYGRETPIAARRARP